MRKPATERIQRAGRTSLPLLRIFTILVRELDDVWLLVTLINLNTEHRRRGWRLLSLLLYGANRYVRSSRDRCAAHVQTLGILRHDGILMGIERVTQNELNLAFGTGQGQAFRVLGRGEKCDHRSGLSFPGSISFQALAGCNDGNILAAL